MSGGATTLAASYLVLLGLVIWMAARIARENRALAIATLFIWPLAIVALKRQWGRPGSDIRAPFLLVALAACLIFIKANSLGNDTKLQAQTAEINQGLNLGERELDELARDHPEFVASLREAQRAAAVREDADAWGGVEFPTIGDEFSGWEDDDPERDRIYLVYGDLSQTKDGSAGGTGGLAAGGDHFERKRDDVSRSEDLRVRMEKQTADTDDAERVRIASAGLPEINWSTRAALAPGTWRPRRDEATLRAAARKLSFRFGSVPLVAAHATLRLPSAYRFIPGYSLPLLARAASRPFDRITTLGWVVHESVDIAAENAWYVEVEFLKTGLLRQTRRLDLLLPGLAGDPLVDGSGRRFGSDLLAPAWSEESGMATWGVLDSSQGMGRAEILAALPLRHGVLIFVMHDVEPEHFELALRATRLLALNTRVDRLGETAQFEPGRDRLARKDFLAWIRGESLEASPARD